MEQLDMHKPDAICLQETWLAGNSDVSHLHLNGYNFIYEGFSASRHGGVGLYLREDLRYRVIRRCSPTKSWDGVFVEVTPNRPTITPTCKNIVIGSIYRPPRNNVNNYNDFIQEIDAVFSDLQNQNKEVVLAGDFNMDLLKFRENSHIDEFLEVILTNGYLPKITSPTRATESSETLIDNILVKLTGEIAKTTSGIIGVAVSDHYPCFSFLDNFSSTRNSYKYVKYRPGNQLAYESFKREVGEACKIDEFNLPVGEDPNINYDILHNKIQAAFFKNFPEKICRYNKYKHKKTKWITQGILRSIRFRDKLYNKMKNSENNPTLHQTLKTNLRIYNSILKKVIRDSKKSFYNACFTSFRNDIKKTWQMIGAIISPKKKKSEQSESFMINGDMVDDPEKIVESFNEYFVKIGSDLANSIQHTDNSSFNDYLKTPHTSTFHFKLVNTEDVAKIIRNMKPKTSRGVDNVSNKLLKEIQNEITEPMTVIINQIITTGIFPNKLKLAKVVPIKKKMTVDILRTIDLCLSCPACRKWLKESYIHSL